MLIMLSIALGYILIGVITGRLYFNHCINDEYKKALSRFAEKNYSNRFETREEHALRVAENEVRREEGAFPFLVGWFWPFFCIFMLCYGFWVAVKYLIGDSILWKSKAVRETERSISQRERENAIKEAEEANKIELERLQAIAKDMKLDIKGLEEL